MELQMLILKEPWKDFWSDLMEQELKNLLICYFKKKMEDDYTRLKDQFGVAVGIFQGMIEKSKKKTQD
jgi:flavodoxin